MHSKMDPGVALPFGHARLGDRWCCSDLVHTWQSFYDMPMHTGMDGLVEPNPLLYWSDIFAPDRGNNPSASVQ